ncbi:MAG TPA: response regulator [Anaeromyxobacter sp.]|nr:response regulator [Anaeromyxobacter sp.]
MAQIPPSTRIHLVDDEGPFLESLARLLRLKGLTVVTHSSAEEFLARSAGDDGACLVVDLNMPGLSGIELLEVLAETHPELPVVFISGSADVPSSVRAMKRGAVDFLTKPFEPEALLAAIEAALAQRARIRGERLRREESRQRLAQLTPRERQVVERVAHGLLNKQIALELGTSEHTVKVHRSNALSKLGVSSLPDLVRLVDQAGEP